MARAAEHGLCVSKPWGETARYDFAVEHDGHFVRVQVKSTMFVDRGGYSCSVRGCRGPYEGDPFDFLAVYLIPEDLWCIIPAKKVRGQGSVALYPKLKKSRYERYREAWRLLRKIPTLSGKNAEKGGAPEEGMVELIEACAGRMAPDVVCDTTHAGV